MVLAMFVGPANAEERVEFQPTDPTPPYETRLLALGLFALAPLTLGLLVLTYDNCMVM